MRTVLIVLALLAITVVAVLWLLPPPAPRRSVREKCRLDDIVPVFQFGEFHERFVRASPEAVDHAIRSVPADEILLFRTLTFLRNPARLFGRQKENILNPPAGKPILEVATRSGFVMLSDEPGREIVLGTLVARPAGVQIAVSGDTAATARRFAELSAPGYAKAATNFRIEPRPDGSCRLTTETRIFATDRVTARRFATYWRFILPGSSLLRVTWLRAIADRAESRR